MADRGEHAIADDWKLPRRIVEVRCAAPTAENSRSGSTQRLRTRPARDGQAKRQNGFADRQARRGAGPRRTASVG